MKILIIKLAALGDVLRTTPLAPALKEAYPECQIYWVVDADCAEVLEDNPFIDQLFPLSEKALAWLGKQKFDFVINLDKDEAALKCMMSTHALSKKGFILDGDSKLCPADEASRYAYELGINDELKFLKNQKSYQEIIFEQCGLVFKKQEYIFNIEESHRQKARTHLEKAGYQKDIPGPVVGINTGSGKRFAGKKLPPQAMAQLAQMFISQMGGQVILLGGKAEIELNNEIKQFATIPLIDSGAHSIKVFAGIVELCDLVVTGDTTAMHIAIAMKRALVCFFGSTCAAEIELYGRGKKITSGLECAPCYKSRCPIEERCMSELSLQEIVEAGQALLIHKRN